MHIDDQAGCDSLPQASAIAPGKLILTGEHSVVYGRPAVVMAVNRFAHTTAKHGKTSAVSISFPALNLRSKFSVTELYDVAVWAHRRLLY